jgi:hypothetical protein
MLYQIRIYNPSYLLSPLILYSVNSEPLWFVKKRGSQFRFDLIQCPPDNS